MVGRIRPMHQEMLTAEHAQIQCDSPALLSPLPITLSAESTS